MTPISPEVLAVATKFAKEGLVTIIAPAVLKETKKYWKKDHGSKVKEGAYKNCSIDMFGSKACILVEPEQGKVLLLTDEEIAGCKFIKDKFRIKCGKTYYYYEITFKDGSRSIVRMSKKYRDAMCEYVAIY